MASSMTLNESNNYQSAELWLCQRLFDQLATGTWDDGCSGQIKSQASANIFVTVTQCKADSEWMALYVNPSDTLKDGAGKRDASWFGIELVS